MFNAKSFLIQGSKIYGSKINSIIHRQAGKDGLNARLYCDRAFNPDLQFKEARRIVGLVTPKL